MHRGRGPGLPDYRQGSKGGSPSGSLTPAKLPSHTHTMKPRCSNSGGTSTAPLAGYHGVSASDDPPAEFASTHDATMAEQLTDAAGSSQPVDVQDPYLAVNYCIALAGVFPSRN
jgi:microcystin-dependent protein